MRLPWKRFWEDERVQERGWVLVPARPGAHLRFWYQVLTCVSLSWSEAASSMRSWTLRYFCFWKLLSRRDSCCSLNAVRALRDFFGWKVECEAPPSSEQSAQSHHRPPLHQAVPERAPAEASGVYA